MSNRILCFRGGKLLRDGQFREGELWVRDGTIIPPAPSCDERIDASGLLIAPGYIDLQVNGTNGRDFSCDADALEVVSRSLALHGVTAYLPTLISLAPADYRRLLPSLQRHLKSSLPGATPLGLHLEGPFLHPRYAGAHSIENLQEPTLGYDSLEHVRLVTLAPELPQAAVMIALLRERGIVVAAGHSHATYAEMEEALLAGLGLVTHLFNAMRPFHHREPGLIGAALTRRDLPFTLIADGVHLHPATVRLAWQANPDGLILVSDMIGGAGKGVTLSGQTATLAGSNTLAGSVIPLDQAVRNLRDWSGCSAAQAIEAATLKPARLLGLASVKGCLDVGADADLILLDPSLNVRATYINGLNIKKS